MYYSSKQIITQASRMEAFEGIPDEYWIACIRKNLEDQQPNKFNDVFHLMHGDRWMMSTTGTTVPGLPALKGGYRKYNKKGAAVLKADVWMNDAFKYGLHSGRMPALRQVKDVYAYRDGNNNPFAEELGTPRFGMWNTNFHASTYNAFDTVIRRLIGHWSYGCIVCNNRRDYNVMIKLCKPQESVSIIILNEFSI